MHVLVRAALFGAATGGRSQLPSSALAVTLVAGDQPVNGVARVFASRRRRNVLVLGAVGELVGDKLPATPTRLQPPGLAARLVAAALGSAAIAVRDERSPWLSATVGATAALAASFGGARWRQTASASFGRDLPGALIEDAVVVGAALASVRGL